MYCNKEIESRENLYEIERLRHLLTGVDPLLMKSNDFIEFDLYEIRNTWKPNHIFHQVTDIMHNYHVVPQETKFPEKKS